MGFVLFIFFTPGSFSHSSLVNYQENSPVNYIMMHQ